MRFSKALRCIETHVTLSGLFSMGSRNHGFTPVYTRGYNMPSRWDYCRLTAALQALCLKKCQPRSERRLSDKAVASGLS